jgi:hypothetical protein
MLETLAFNAWHIGRVVLPLAVVAYLGYDLGHTQASRTAELAQARLAQQYTAERAQDSQLHARQLQASQARYLVLQQQANQIGSELLHTRAALAQAQAQHRKRIPHVTQQDGPAFTGLGPDSLRLSQRFLGYTDTDLAAAVPAADAGHAAATAEAAPAAAGLLPRDLLAHAADYGQWCQQLENQLQLFIRLHQEAAPP